MRENIFLLSSLVLMKAAFQHNPETITHILRLWQQTGIVQHAEWLSFFIIYMAQTQEIPKEELVRMIEENKIEGEKTMATIAQQWKDEGKLEGKLEGRLEGKQETLTAQLSKRFQLTEFEKELIQSTTDVRLLDAALNVFVTAVTKEEILALLKKQG